MNAKCNHAEDCKVKNCPHASDHDYKIGSCEEGYCGAMKIETVCLRSHKIGEDNG